jgi:hypothetical protein
MKTLYEDILEIARTYMGIAAQDYIDRRCRIVARDTKPEDVTVERLDRLLVGIDMTAKVYMSEARVAAFKQEIADLRENHR